jgi:hypothetical protein
VERLIPRIPLVDILDIKNSFLEVRISVKITTRFGFSLPPVGAQRRWQFEASENGKFGSSDSPFWSLLLG